MAEVCKNCNHIAHEKFCPNCGQATHTHPIDWKYLGHEIQHGLFHVDRGIFYTTRCLLFHPGYTVQEFIEGKRVRHFKPLAYLVIVTTVYLLLSAGVGSKSFLAEFVNAISRYKSNNSSGTLQSIRAVFLWLQNHAVYLTILSIPAFALASKWAFKKFKRNYVEHLILHCYLTGLRSVLFLLLLPVRMIAQDNASKSLLTSLHILIAVFTTVWAFAEFFRPSPFWKLALRSLLFAFWLFLFFIFLSIFLGIVFRTPGR